MPLIRINAAEIRDWATFHDGFAKWFGFPDFYGRNMNAWIDCMTYLDDPGAGMTTIHGSTSDPVVLCLDNVNAMPNAIFEALVECAAFVNWRRIETGDPAILLLAFHKTA
jgi:hypothetical protein